jgi:hypothetical protein
VGLGKYPDLDAALAGIRKHVVTLLDRIRLLEAELRDALAKSQRWYDEAQSWRLKHEALNATDWGQWRQRAIRAESERDIYSTKLKKAQDELRTQADRIYELRKEAQRYAYGGSVRAG